MNSQELVRIVDGIARDKNIERDQIYNDIEQAVASGLRKQFNTEDTSEFTVKLDRVSGVISAQRQGVEVPLSVVGRIGAQTVKQVMIQLIRQDERGSIYEEYKDRVGTIITGTVARFEKDTMIVTLLRNIEGIMPRSEQIPGEVHQVGERVQRERAADAVHREPADTGDHGVDPGGQDVAPVAEPEPAQHHLRHPVLRAAQRQDALGDAADRAAEEHGQRRRPEAHPESRHREHADEDRRELHVRRRPGPEQLQRTPVPFVQRDELRAARLDGHHLRAVATLADQDARLVAVRKVLIPSCHIATAPPPTVFIWHLPR